jgi:hypothetical protein
MNRSMVVLALVSLSSCWLPAPRSFAQEIPDSTQLKNLQLIHSMLSEKQAIAQLQGQLAGLYFPIGEVKSPEGKLTPSDSVALEARLLVSQQLDAAVGTVATVLDSIAGDGTLLLFDPKDIADLAKYNAFMVQSQNLIDRSRRVKPREPGTSGPRAALPALAIAGSLLKSLGGITGLLRADVTYAARAVGVSDEVLVAKVASRMNGRLVSTAAIVADDTTSALFKQLDTLTSLRAKLPTVPTPPVSPPAPPPASGGKKAMPRHDSHSEIAGTDWESPRGGQAAPANSDVKLAQAVDEFLDRTYEVDPQTGLSPLALLMRAGAIHERLASNSHFLVLKIVGAHASSENRSSTFRRSLRFAALVQVRYAVIGSDGSIVAADVVTRTSGYQKGTDLIQNAKSTPSGPARNPSPQLQAKGN